MDIALDTETHLIRPGRAAPPLVCVSLAFRGHIPRIIRELPPEEGESVSEGGLSRVLLSRDGWRRVWRVVLSAAASNRGRLIGQNFAFDALVLLNDNPDTMDYLVPLYEAGAVSDTWLRERLRNIADGLGAKLPNGLSTLAAKYIGDERGEAAKAAKYGPDAWRMRYAELDGVPLTEWPRAAVSYPLGDAEDTLLVWEKQGGATGPYEAADGRNTEARETRAHLALASMGVWGIRTDPAVVERLRREWATSITRGHEAARAGGFYREEYHGPRGGSRPAGIVTKELQRLISDAFDGKPPRTPKGSIKTDEETLLAVADMPGAPPNLREFAKSRKAAKLESVWGSWLSLGTTIPITARWNPLVDTGRTSCGNPPWQQQPRGGGTREAVVPRPGMLLVTADFNAAELRALGQLCKWMGLGTSLIEAFERGIDLHCHTAATYTGRSYEEFVALYEAGDEWAAEQRQAAKAVNFGLPGGLGTARLIAHVFEQTGIEMSEDEAWAYRRAWAAAWPEAAAYLRLIGSKIEAFERAGRRPQFTHPVSGRLRGGVGYTDGCNGFFQGLVADIIKAAAWEMWLECYYRPASVLYGARPILCMHDELIGEVPAERAEECAEAWSAVMVRVAREHAPDVPWKAKPSVMDRWRKG